MKGASARLSSPRFARVSGSVAIGHLQSEARQLGVRLFDLARRTRTSKMVGAKRQKKYDRYWHADEPQQH
jgi:hypothetical protein